MNPVSIHALFTATPEGFDTGKLRQRTCCLVSFAMGALVPLPGAEINRAELRNYFMENSAMLRKCAVEINETVPFNLDRALDYAYWVFERRYDVAHFCRPTELLDGGSFKAKLESCIPEYNECAVDGAAVDAVIKCFREFISPAI